MRVRVTTAVSLVGIRGEVQRRFAGEPGAGKEPGLRLRAEGEVAVERAEDLSRERLVGYLQDVHALEQNLLLQLDSLVLNTRDFELARIFRAHREETRRQEERLRERLRALGGFGLSSLGKDLSAIAGAGVKGVADVLRGDKEIRNARDAFVSEHLEIASYELLVRLAERAGDAETAELAREHLAEERAMAERISSNWDRFVDAALQEEGRRRA
jgi:ferritin-like metal-binding protein YciE